MQVPELVRYAKSRLCEELAKAFLSSDEVILEATEDPIQSALLVRARGQFVAGSEVWETGRGLAANAPGWVPGVHEGFET